MKLFITNQQEFKDNFPIEDKNSYTKNFNDIHRDAFNKLSNAVSENNIPIVLITDYDEFGDVLFQFKKLVDEIYFYE